MQSASRVTSEQSILQRLETLRAAFAKIEAVTGTNMHAVIASCSAQHRAQEAPRLCRPHVGGYLSLLTGLHRWWLEPGAGGPVLLRLVRLQAHGCHPAGCGAAGMTDMAELAEALSAVQEHSFGLFRFVGDLNLEVERLEDRAAAAEAELESSRAAVAAAQQEQSHRAQVNCSAMFLPQFTAVAESQRRHGLPPPHA